MKTTDVYEKILADNLTRTKINACNELCDALFEYIRFSNNLPFVTNFVELGGGVDDALV